MAAPLNRMGFRQASLALRKHGFRPCRVEKAPRLAGCGYKFAAVPLKRGLNDATVATSDVQGWGDTLTELVQRVEAKAQASPSPVTVPGAQAPYSAAVGSDPSPVQTATTATAAATVATQDKLDALNVLLAGGATVSDDQLRDAIRLHGRVMLNEATRDVQDKWTEMVERTEAALAERETSVEAKIAMALKQVQTTAVVLTRPDVDPVTITGQHAQFGVLLRELGFGNSCYVTGPAGSGKTTAAIKVAEALKRPYFLMRAVLDPFELVGFIDGGGSYRDTPLYKWATTPGAILIMDEIDRSNPKAIIAINAAWNGIIAFPHETVTVPPENLIMATANTWGQGTDAEYVGSCRLDGATLDRFPSRIVWGYDLALESRLSGNAEEAAWCQRLRKVADDRGLRIIFSPRTIIAHCKRLAGGVSRKESLEVSCLAALDSDVRESLLQEVGA